MRGLLMIEPLYKQTICGYKTMTRRDGGLSVVNQNPDWWRLNGNFINTKEVAKEIKSRALINRYYLFENTVGTKVWCKPRYKIGEVLYLKEPYSGQNGHYNYKFSFKDNSPMRESIKWKNKLFMPADAGRIFVKITDIKCERLLDISDADCRAEGIEMGYAGNSPFGYINYLMTTEYGYDYIDNTPKESFISLYKLANKMAKVGSVPPHGSLPTPIDVPNIWVWAYTYEYLTDYKK